MSTEFEHPNALLDAVGQDLGKTKSMLVEQQRINTFADATGDHQWIHVDPEKAATGPFGTCIAHGYLTLSLVNYFLPDLLKVNNVKMGVNYGCDKVRFPNIVKVGASIYGHGEVVAAEEVKGGVQVTVRVSVFVEGEDRPACVADTISRFYPN